MRNQSVYTQTYHAEDDDENVIEDVGDSQRKAENYAEDSGPTVEISAPAVTVPAYLGKVTIDRICLPEGVSVGPT